MLRSLCFFLVSIVSLQCFAQTLERRASWDARFTLSSPVGAQITELSQSSPLAQAGLQIGDIIQAVNGQVVSDQAIWSDLTDSLVGEKPYQIRYLQGGKVNTAKATFAPQPLESYPNLEVIYDQLFNHFGFFQRTIITKPEDQAGRLPAIFVVQGLSCSSIEYTPGRQSNFIRSIRNVVQQSGMVVMRVEKPGLGDSQGNCSQTDLNTELLGYELAIQKLKSLPFVDPKRIIIYGSSMGSALAPYLAEKHQLNGVISDGTFFRSWFEHMLEIERRIKTMQGVSQWDLNEQMTKAYIPLYYGMLVEQKSYQQIITDNPFLAQYNYHGLQHMYGRPMAYYHQIQAFNFAGYWEKLSVPVRIRWGTNDWIMSQADNDMILDRLTTAGNTNVALYKYPGLDHWDTVHTSAENSFNGKPGEWQDKISAQIVDWAKEINHQAWRLE